MALLTVEGITKRFGGLQVLNGVDLTVAEGSLTGLVGPNGSGKTTLFNVIFGLYRPDGGFVRFRDRDITGFPPYKVYQAGLAFAFQLPRLFYRLTVLDNVILAARRQRGESFWAALFARRAWRREERDLAEKAYGILELLEMPHMALKPAGELSGGQRKLLEIGRALMAEPELLLLDEPAAGVSPALALKVYELLARLREKGITIFIIEHRLDLLLNFADRIYLMDKGAIALSGPPAAVTEDPVFYSVYVGEHRKWVS